MDVKEILEQWLNEYGYDGLFSQGECACLSDELAPCGESCLECQPGYINPDPSGEFDYLIIAKKPNT